MRIVNRQSFLALPAGTLFSKFQPVIFGELNIKGESTPNDFYYQDIAGAVACDNSDEFMDILERAIRTGESFDLNLECMGRDGLYDADQLFAIWEPKDVTALIARLESAMQECVGTGLEG